jgi:hypothetical protein
MPTYVLPSRIMNVTVYSMVAYAAISVYLCMIKYDFSESDNVTVSNMVMFKHLCVKYLMGLGKLNF